MSQAISGGTYHIVSASGREFAFRRLGSGPPVAMLHESPRSSAALLPLAQRLAERYTVFAFDTPGFGLSEPLGVARADADEFADEFIAAFDAIGLGRVPVYGTHTGAAIAIEIARRHQDRCACAVLDGFAMFTPVEQAEYLASYLAPIRPDWEGTYLAWLWARVRDQYAFFPWYMRGPGSRLPRPAPPIEHHQTVVADLLAAGDAYRVAYAAAFRYDAPAGIAATQTPICFAAREDDLLFPHLDRLPKLDPRHEILRLSADRDAWGKAIGMAMARGTGDAQPPRFDDDYPATEANTVARRFVVGKSGQLLMRVAGNPVSPIIVLVPGDVGASRDLEPIMRRLAKTHRVLAFDLPGHGGSHEAGDTMSITLTGAEISAAISRLKLGNVTLAGFGSGGAIAAETAYQLGARAACCVLVEPPPEAQAARQALADNLVDIAPRWDGGHLHSAWHRLRDAEIWRPWFERTPEAARIVEPTQDVPKLSAAMTEWMRGGPSYARVQRAALAESPRAAIGKIGRVAVVAVRDEPGFAAAKALAESNGRSFAACARHPEQIAGAIVRAAETA